MAKSIKLKNDYYWDPSSIAVKTIKSGENLNDFITSGIYRGYEVSTNEYSNVPVKTGPFILEIFKTPEGIVCQRYTQCRENNSNNSNISQGTFMRFYTTNWSRWQGNASAVTYEQTSGSTGWFLIFKSSYLGGWADTSAIITIKSGSAGPMNCNGTIRFTQYHTSSPITQISEGNISPSRVKVVLNNTDKMFEVYVKVTSTYTPLHIFYQTSSHNAIEINPLYYGTAEPTGSSVYNVLPPEYCYRAGQTYEITGYTALSGFLTSSKTSIQFSLPVAKSLEFITNITINSYNLDIRHADGGYIGTGITSVAGKIVANKRSDNLIEITITLDSATSFTNNSTIAVGVNTLKLTFN